VGRSRGGSADFAGAIAEDTQVRGHYRREGGFPPPTAQNLGISTDPNQALPVTVVVTDDHKVYFCRSELNPADYIIWVRAVDKESSYLFLTNSDLKLIRTVYLKSSAFPEVLEAASAQIQAIYKNALVALGKDVGHSSH
jgi:hypothetical protein